MVFTAVHHGDTMVTMYSVSQKNNPPLRFSEIFSQTVGIFLSVFYTPILRSFLHWITNFYLNISNFDKVMPY